MITHSFSYVNVQIYATKCPSQAFSPEVTAAMLVYQLKRILGKFFCLVHQYGRFIRCQVDARAGMSESQLVKTIYKIGCLQKVPTPLNKSFLSGIVSIGIELNCT